jgi:hypothetical protein
MNPHNRYTPHHEPSLPSSLGPTTHYLAVSSSSSSSTNAVTVCHHRHRRHHGVGCCLVPPAATVIFAIVVHHRCNPTNDGVPAASPRPSPPLRSPSPPLPSCPLRPLDRPWRRHGPACSVDTLPPGPTRQVPLPHAPPSSGYGLIAPAPSSRPPQCRGFLSGGRRETLLCFSGRRRRSGDSDGSTATLTLVPGNPAPRRRRRGVDMLGGWVMFCVVCCRAGTIRILCFC